jgi:acylphosphatase
MTETGAIVRSVLVEGNVQGVGYREFIRRAALRLSVSGWGRNRPSGAVEALIRGPPAAVEALIAEIRKGPRFATVNSVSVTALDEPPPQRERRVRYPANGIAQRRRAPPLPISPVAATCRVWGASFATVRGHPRPSAYWTADRWQERILPAPRRASLQALTVACLAVTFVAVSSRRLRGVAPAFEGPRLYRP